MKRLLAVIGCIVLLAGCKQEVLNPPPATYVLKQNYPNPFVDSTTIEYGIPNLSPGSGPNIKIIVYDRFNRKQATLISAVNHPAGSGFTLMYDGRGANGTKIGTGIYYVEMQRSETQILGPAEVEVVARIAIFKR